MSASARVRFTIAVVWLLGLLAPGCGSGGTGSSSGSVTSPATTASVISQQVVFMLPVGTPPPSVPGPGAVYEIAVINLDGSGLRQLTSDGTFKFLPHFSPDGTKLVYTKYAVGGYGSPIGQADVAVFDLASSKETMVTTGGANVQGTWSPDGRRIAYLGGVGTLASGVSTMWIVGVDGSNPHQVASAAGTPDDLTWGDIAWSSDDWILFTASQNNGGCFKVRTDKIRPDGSSRTQVTDGGAGCTPAGFEQSGDADPGWSHDGKTIYSSRGFPYSPAGMPGATVRKLYAFSSDAWYAGKPETDLSLPSQPDGIEGVPKGSPDGTRILLFRTGFGPGVPSGIYVTDTAGSYRNFVAAGFGADWNPTAK